MMDFTFPSLKAKRIYVCLRYTDPCLNVRIINDAGVPFILYSSLKPEGYLVTGPEIDLHYVIRNGMPVSFVEPPHKRDEVLDSGGEIISEVRCTLNI